MSVVFIGPDAPDAPDPYASPTPAPRPTAPPDAPRPNRRRLVPIVNDEPLQPENLVDRLNNPAFAPDPTSVLHSDQVLTGVLKRYQNEHGGLNNAGRAFYNRQGSHLHRPVPHPRGPEGEARRHSFCARMGGVPGPMEKDGKPTRKALALRAWNC